MVGEAGSAKSVARRSKPAEEGTANQGAGAHRHDSTLVVHEACTPSHQEKQQASKAEFMRTEFCCGA